MQYPILLHPFCCKAHWQNAHSQRFNQILPKSLSALPTLTHGQKVDAAKMKEDKTRKTNNETLINRNMSGLQDPAIITC